SAPPARPRPAVVIDPGHGGDDRGALLSPSLPEKQVTLAWARRLRSALQQKGITAILLRDSDISLTLDERAALANAARPQVFITLHAGSVGTGVRIYTAHMGESAPRAGSFLPWNSAQAAFLDGSRAVAGSIAAEMRKREIPSGTAPVFLRPLTNIAGPGVAIEVMPVTADVGTLMSAGYQYSVCAAIADGIAASGKLSARKAVP
ncbi:MAG TPA: N-acetylmuramoyl-L-alanine amidase, partial [Alphaproteobacteria bacterium]|nr:N-acetylmuramoyl-L-alanine amidase [Alphaproteobacteria bacterium]